MKKQSNKTVYLYDLHNGLTLMNILTKNDAGKLDRVDTYLGVEGHGFSTVGSTENLSAPGVIFRYSSYVRQQEGMLGYYIECFEQNTGVRVHGNGDSIWFEEVKG